MTQQIKDEEFIELWNAHASVTKVADILRRQATASGDVRSH